MKVLIISDTHRHLENLETVLDKVKPIDMLIHLGDIEGSDDYIEYLADCSVNIVAGNNDFFSRLPKEQTLYIGKYKVFITHGHLYNVSFGLDYIMKRAKEKTADIVMFGHTHKPLIHRNNNMVFLNPGSLSYPRQEGRNPSFIILETDQNGEAHFTINYLNN